MNKGLLIISILLLTQTLTAQYCTNDTRFTEVEYFTDSEIDSIANVTYATVIDWQSNTQNLQYDVFFPSANVETLTQRPCVMVIHGGGFTTGSKAGLHRTCQELAKRGYVAITINYRLGWSTQTEQIEAIYRAEQDAKAALRHIVANASTYQIDLNWIFIGGGSAGSITALNTVYVSQSEWSFILPNAQTTLGDLNTSGNTLTNAYDIKGIFNNWGATTGQFMQPNEMIPTISFHGELDNTVPIDSASNGFTGSRPIHNKLIANGVCSELTVQTDGAHGIYKSIEGTAFRTGRASCFFKSIFCNTCTDLYTTDSIHADCSMTTNTENSISTNDITVYPNPFHGQLNIEITTEKAENIMLQIIDNTGRVILSKNENLYRGENILTLNLDNQANGIYYLMMNNGSQIWQKKILLIH